MDPRTSPVGPKQTGLVRRIHLRHALKMHYSKLETCIQQYEVRRFVQFYQIHIVWSVHQKAEHFCLKYKMVPMTCPMWHWMISTPVASSDSDFHQAIGYEPREDGTLCTSKISKSNFRNYLKFWHFQNFEFFLRLTASWNGRVSFLFDESISSILLFGHRDSFFFSKTGTTKTSFSEVSNIWRFVAKLRNCSRIWRLGITSTSIRNTWEVATPLRATLRRTLWG